MQGQYYTGKALTTALLLVSPLLLTGCIAAGAAAGGAAGAAAASGDEDRKDLEYWLKTNDHTTRIGTAMRKEKIIEGMSKTHVKLVMDVKGRYDALPDSIGTTEEGRTQWTYIPNLDQYSTYKITFNSEELASQVERVETEDDDNIPNAPRGGGS
jgi:hypothetical protein